MEEHATIMRKLMNELNQATQLSDIRPPSEDINTVGSSNFTDFTVIGNETMNIDDLQGGVSTDHNEIARVKQLAAEISSPDGYFSRIIVEPDGNVIEGQHRLEALRLLGITDVPVFVLKDKHGDLPVNKMADAIRAVGGIQYDHINQIISQISDMLNEVGSAKAVVNEFDFPKGFERYFIAALRVLD